MTSDQLKFGKLLCGVLHALHYDAKLEEGPPFEAPYVAAYHPIAGPRGKLLVGVISLKDGTAAITYHVPTYKEGIGRALATAGDKWKTEKHKK